MKDTISIKLLINCFGSFQKSNDVAAVSSEGYSHPNAANQSGHTRVFNNVMWKITTKMDWNIIWPRRTARKNRITLQLRFKLCLTPNSYQGMVMLPTPTI